MHGGPRRMLRATRPSHQMSLDGASAAEAGNATFPQFTRLPPEIRERVWQEATRQPGLHWLRLLDAARPAEETDGGRPMPQTLFNHAYSQRFYAVAPFAGSWLVGNPSAYVTCNSLSRACSESRDALQRQRLVDAASRPRTPPSVKGGGIWDSVFSPDDADEEDDGPLSAERLLSRDLVTLKADVSSRGGDAPDLGVVALQFNRKSDLVCLQFDDWDHVTKPQGLHPSDRFWFRDGYGVNFLADLERVALEYDHAWEPRFEHYVDWGDRPVVGLDRGGNPVANPVSPIGLFSGDPINPFTAPVFHFIHPYLNAHASNPGNPGNNHADENNGDDVNEDTADADGTVVPIRTRVRLGRGVNPEHLDKSLLAPMWMPAHFPKLRSFYIIDYSIRPREGMLASAREDDREVFNASGWTFYEVRPHDHDVWVVTSHVFAFVSWLRRAGGWTKSLHREPDNLKVLACHVLP